MRTPKRAVRGVSLIEAVVALAVMAFGMLAYVGLQGTLRFNSDVSKQRSEAVRIAQEALEEWRAYGFIESKDGKADYEDIVGATDPIPGTNATYTLLRTVVDAATTPPVTAAAPRMKTLVVDVSWLDRNGDEQAVRLSTTVAASPPELAGTLSLPSHGPVHLPQGRNQGIPAPAIAIGGGKSAFKPPGASDSTIVWVFDNLSGVITSVCTFPGDDLQLLAVDTACISMPSYLLSGFVRFSPGTSPVAANPTGEQIDLGMLADAVGDAFADGECFVTPVQEPKLTHTTYVCRVPQSADSTWTGITLLSPPLNLTEYDVCRYANDAEGNAGHPQVYVHLNRSLGNQNFLVVSQGVACPMGTLAHQPPP
jgi:Tfp pilus assembly protein PilV